MREPAKRAGREGSGVEGARAGARLAAYLDSDVLYSFLASKLVVAAALLTVLMVGAAMPRPVPSGPGTRARATSSW